MTLPNLFVAGAQKSGTTSLHRYLQSHPDIWFPPRPQEIHFFDAEKNYARGLDWYARFFNGCGDASWIAQTSPLYMYYPDVPARIASVAPDARFVFILRNPVERAYSHYWLAIRYGMETLPFNEALAVEAERIREGYDQLRFFSYADRGYYAAQLRRFLAHFPRASLHILVTEAFAEEPERTAAQLAEFLGIDGGAFPRRARKSRVYNRAKMARWPRLQRWARPLRLWTPTFYAIIEAVNLRETAYPPMEPALRKQLTERFAADVEALATEFGVDVSPWADFS